jgi:DNA-binding FadR family transcriptional regulator
MQHRSTKFAVSGRANIGLNLTQRTLETLGKAIVTGRFEGRPFPNEGELAKAYGVSRAVTREAVKMLTAKGLIISQPRQCTLALPMSEWNLFDADVLRWRLEHTPSAELLRQFYQMLLAIEPAGAALATQFHGRADFAVIRICLDRIRAADEGQVGLLDANIDFRVAVLRASQNPFYAQFGTAIATALRASTSIAAPVEMLRTNLPDFDAVVEAITARDVDGARAAMGRIVGNLLNSVPEGGEG